MRRELDARLAAARAWEAEVEGYFLQAKSLGLLPGSPSPQSGWTLDRYMLELRKVPEMVRALDLPDVAEGTAEAAVNELTQLINEEDRLGQEIGAAQRRLSKLDQLSSSVGDYNVTLTAQEDRLLGLGWLEQRLQNPHQCPVCSATHMDGNPHLSDLQTLASELKALTASVQQAPPKLDEEAAILKQELRRLEADISRTRQTRRIIEARSATQAAQRQRIRQIYLFVGRVEQALENVTASRNVDDLSTRVRNLATRIGELRRELDPNAQRNRISAALDATSARIAFYAQLLELEHASENVRLNIRELTLQFTPLSGRTDYLWEVGSGQNWVGYHVAGLLALHEHFIRRDENPVPRFLMIDQPSQVYFPEAWPTIEQAPTPAPQSRVSSDIEGVRRIFRALSQFLKAVSGQFQIIVTEHAGSITWADIPDIHFVGNWRDGHDPFLIPESWYRNE